LGTRLKIWSQVFTFTVLMGVTLLTDGSIVAVAALAVSAAVLIITVAGRMRSRK